MPWGQNHRSTLIHMVVWECHGVHTYEFSHDKKSKCVEQNLAHLTLVLSFPLHISIPYPQLNFFAALCINFVIFRPFWDIIADM